MVGTGQKAETFWERIMTEYNEKREEKKAQKSLLNRWSALSKTVAKFRGVYNRVCNRNISGANEAILMTEAQELYKVEMGKTFERVSCWEILKSEPKFQVYCDGNSENKAPEGSDADPNKVARPEGKMSAKKVQKSEDVLRSMLNIVEASSKKRERDSAHLFDLMEQQLELQLIVARNDEITDEYLSIKRAKALRRAKRDYDEHQESLYASEIPAMVDNACNKDDAIQQEL